MPSKIPHGFRRMEQQAAIRGDRKGAFSLTHVDFAKSRNFATRFQQGERLVPGLHRSQVPIIVWADISAMLCCDLR